LVLYNSKRPHKSLELMTPVDYILRESKNCNMWWTHTVDAKSGLTHSLVTTAANEHDLNQLGNLLHGEEQFVSADAGYQGAPQREELAEVDVDWLIAERPGK
ncbi:transposase, partial [Klebsiella pneumoniae]|nr:transposase [Klebsiella pneumoniae]